VAFLQVRPAASIRKINRSGEDYLVVLGNVPNEGLSLPSGPPAYIFNKSGNLVDWTGDLGEASDFLRKWGNLDHASVVSPQEAKAFISEPNESTNTGGMPTKNR
jgi:hypothetical protein